MGTRSRWLCAAVLVGATAVSCGTGQTSGEAGVVDPGAVGGPISVPVTAPAELCQAVARWSSLVDVANPDGLQRLAFADMAGAVSTVSEPEVVASYNAVVDAWNAGVAAVAKVRLEIDAEMNRVAANNSRELDAWTRRQYEAIARGDYSSEPPPSGQDYSAAVDVNRLVTTQAFVTAGVQAKVSDFQKLC